MHTSDRLDTEPHTSVTKKYFEMERRKNHAPRTFLGSVTSEAIGNGLADEDEELN